MLFITKNNQILVDQINLFCDISDKGRFKKQDWETYSFIICQP